MGVVVLAQHSGLGNLVAIKVLKSEYTEDERMVARFRREARAASRIHHPNIVFIQDFGQLPDGRFYLVMEYVAGVPLDEVVRKQGFLPVPATLQIAGQVGEALDCAHAASIIHRDLKPENILLAREKGRTDLVKILDFGLAKILEDVDAKTLTLKGQIFGTPEYMSPEQCVGDDLDHRSDIYAFGVLAYELAVGDAPFTGSMVECMHGHCRRDPVAPSEANPAGDLPQSFDELVLRCLAKKPDDRPSSMEEVVGEIRKIRAGLAAEAASSGTSHTVPARLRGSGYTQQPQAVSHRPHGGPHQPHGGPHRPQAISHPPNIVSQQQRTPRHQPNGSQLARGSDPEQSDASREQPLTSGSSPGDLDRVGSSNSTFSYRFPKGAGPIERALKHGVGGKADIESAKSGQSGQRTHGARRARNRARNSKNARSGPKKSSTRRNQSQTDADAALATRDDLVEEIARRMARPGRSSLEPGELTAAFQRRYRKQLKGVAETLLDREMGSPGLALAISKLLDQEEDLYEEETEIASIESRMREIDEAARQRVGQLRHAVIDLSRQRERLLADLGKEDLEADSGGAPREGDGVLEDISFQIRALESRLMEVTADRESKLAQLGDELAERRKKGAVKESRLAELENEVARHIDLVRDQCEQIPELASQLRILDHVKGELIDADERRR
jgi:serine/threonine protein kinase